MADKRPIFVNLEDVTSEEGVPLHKAVEGDAAAGKNSHGVLTVKDSSGNLQYIPLTDDNKVPVSLTNAVDR